MTNWACNWLVPVWLLQRDCGHLTTLYLNSHACWWVPEPIQELFRQKAENERRGLCFFFHMPDLNTVSEYLLAMRVFGPMGVFIFNKNHGHKRAKSAFLAMPHQRWRNVNNVAQLGCDAVSTLCACWGLLSLRRIACGILNLCTPRTHRKDPGGQTN